MRPSGTRGRSGRTGISRQIARKRFGLAEAAELFVLRKGELCRLLKGELDGFSVEQLSSFLKKVSEAEKRPWRRWDLRESLEQGVHSFHDTWKKLSED